MKVTLRQLRKINDLTQQEMAEKIGVSLSTWINWEKRRTFPDVPHIEKISDEFDIDYNNIIFFDTKHGFTVKDKQEA